MPLPPTLPWWSCSHWECPRLEHHYCFPVQLSWQMRILHWRHLWHQLWHCIHQSNQLKGWRRWSNPCCCPRGRNLQEARVKIMIIIYVYICMIYTYAWSSWTVLYWGVSQATRPVSDYFTNLPRWPLKEIRFGNFDTRVIDHARASVQSDPIRSGILYSMNPQLVAPLHSRLGHTNIHFKAYSVGLPRSCSRSAGRFQGRLGPKACSWTMELPGVLSSLMTTKYSVGPNLGGLSFSSSRVM